MKKTILSLLCVAGFAHAQTFVQHIKCELETASGASLPPKTILQGTTPLWSLDQYRQGQATAASTDGTIRAVVVLGQSATNGPWASITNYATSGYGYLVQFPVVGTNSGGATAAPWWYTVLYQSQAGKTYWSGSGRLTIEPTQWTGQDGLGWGAGYSNNALVLIAAETAARIAADNALGVRIDNITVGPGLSTNDMLAVIASVAPTSRVSYAESAGTATTALSVAWSDVTGKPDVATNAGAAGTGYWAMSNGVWRLLTGTIGPQGPAGSNGAAGATGPAGPAGTNATGAVTNGGVTINGVPLGNGTNLTITGGSGLTNVTLAAGLNVTLNGGTAPVLLTDNATVTIAASGAGGGGGGISNVVVNGKTGVLTGSGSNILSTVTLVAADVGAVSNTDARYLAALTNAAQFATAAQGAKADTALQPAQTNGWVVESHDSLYPRSNPSNWITLAQVPAQTTQLYVAEAGMVSGAQSNLIATHTAQIATQDAFRVASTVNYATNSGNAATVGGLTAEDIMRVGVRYYFTTNLISYGAVTGRSCSLVVPTNTQIVVYDGPVTNGQYIATYLMKSTEMPAVFLKGIYSFEFNGYHKGAVGEHPRIGADIYIVTASNGVVVQEFKNTAGTELPRSNESIPAHFVIQVNVTNDFPKDGYAIVLKTKMIDNDGYNDGNDDLYSYFGRDYWSGFVTPVLASQFPTRDEVDGMIDASVGAVQADLTTHTNRQDNPHAVTAAQIGAVSLTGDVTRAGTLGGSNAVLSTDYMTLDQGLSLLGGRSLWYMRGGFDQTVTWARSTSTDIPTTNWTVTIASATAGMYGPSWVITNLSGTVIKAGVISISGIGSSFNSGSSRAASYKWEAYLTNTITDGGMPEWSDQGNVKVLTGTADYVPMTIAISVPTNLPVGSALVLRPKVTAAANTPTITITGGSNSLSSVSLPTGLEANLGTRGATSISVGSANSYNESTRALTVAAVSNTPEGIAAAGGMTNNQPITAAQLPAQVLTNGGPVAVAATNAQYVATNHVAQVGTAAHAGMPTNNGSYAFTLTGGNAITNGAIPGPGCKNFGTSRNLTLDGLTSAYAGRPDGVYTINVSRAASAGYCYVLTTYGTNSYVLGTNLVQSGTHTIGATNRFGFIPDTNGTYQVPQMRVQ